MSSRVVAVSLAAMFVLLTACPLQADDRTENFGSQQLERRADLENTSDPGGGICAVVCLVLMLFLFMVAANAGGPRSDTDPDASTRTETGPGSPPPIGGGRGW